MGGRRDLGEIAQQLHVGRVRVVLGEVRALFGDRKRALGTLLSAVLLAGNWLLYVWAVESGQVLVVIS